ncbi:T9SS type A sorting domain-containing protein [Snuella lapsa]|uniref:Secretion system C-terminal sorting domain-containing protein n=1 Tax=Snuella lapsa TaxID=870481 RepID=A0ABP6WVX1_9FLAO
MKKITLLLFFSLFNFFYITVVKAQIVLESFETETVTSSLFTSGSKSFNIENGQVSTFANSGVGDSQKYLDNIGSCGSQTSVGFKTTDGSDIYIHSLFVYSSTDCSGVPVNTSQAATLKAYKDNAEVFSLTIDDTGGDVTWTNQETNGFTFIDLVSLGYGDTLVDEVSLDFSGGTLIYAAIDEIIWSQSPVGNYNFENFETASDNSTTFISNSQSFTLNNSLQVHTDGTSIGASESLYYLDNLDSSPSIIADGGTPYSASIETTDGNDIFLKGFYLYMSNNGSYNDLHSVGVTIKGYKDGSGTPVFTQTFSPTFDDDNKGFNFLGLSNINQSILIDKFEVVPLNNTVGGANEVHYLAIDNLYFEIPTAPTVTTTSISIFDATSATMGGNVTADGGTTVTERGVVYAITSENANPQIGGANVIKDDNSSGTGMFSESITGLTANTQYSYAAYAINNKGTSYGVVKTFVTGTLGLEQDLLKDSVSIFPNPIGEALFVKTKSNVQIESIEVYDLTGKKLKVFKQITEKLDFSDLSIGLYIINIHSNKGTISKSIIKE